MPFKIGDVVRVSFTDKASSQRSTVVGVVEAVDAAQGITTVFVGGKQSWRVPTSGVVPLALPASFSWTASDTERVRSSAAAYVTGGSSPARREPVSLAAAKEAPTQPKAPAAPAAAAAAVTAAPKVEDAPHATAANLSVPSSSFRGHDNHSFEPNASYTNILCELNARLTGLSTWSSPPLTALFLLVLYLWLAMEGSGVPSWSRGPPLLSVGSVAQRCGIAIARTLLAVVLCTCVSMAPRPAAASTFWLLFPLTVVSFGGFIPIRWWNTVVVVCLPLPLPTQGGRDTAAPAAAAPLFLWVVKMVLDGVRYGLRGLSRAMIMLGESLRAVSEKSD